MQDLKIFKPKKKPKVYANQNLIEAVTGIGSGVIDSAKYDLAKGAVNEAWDELLGKDQDQATKGHDQVRMDHGELSEGAELDLSVFQEKAVEITEMGRQYSSEVIHAESRANAENSHEVQVKMHEILIEIKKISESSKELKDQIDVITLEQTGEDPGIYHVNLYEQILSKIHDLRLSLDDSLAWFKTLRSKNSARKYGAQAKKHGTSFTLSSERQVSTQVG